MIDIKNIKYIDNYITYRNLKRSIYRQKFKIKDLEDELQFVIDKSGPQDARAQTYDLKAKSGKVESVNSLYDEIINLSKQINTLKQELNLLEQKKLRAEWIIENDLNSTEKQVLFLREIEGLSLWEIAFELNYSYDYVREVNSKIEKKIREVIKSKKTHKNPQKQKSDVL